MDRLVWIKKCRDLNSLVISNGYYLLHSTEICLIGVKHSNEVQKLQFIAKVTNDVLFSKISGQSQKPEAIYDVIDAMVPGAKKIELFATNRKYVAI